MKRKQKPVTVDLPADRGPSSHIVVSSWHLGYALCDEIFPPLADPASLRAAYFRQFYGLLARRAGGWRPATH